MLSSSDRLVRVLISPTDLLKMFEFGVCFNSNLDLCIELPRLAGVPLEAKVLSSGYDFGRQAYFFILEHKEFQKVPNGQEIPIWGTATLTLELRLIELPSPDHVIVIG